MTTTIMTTTGLKCSHRLTTTLSYYENKTIIQIELYKTSAHPSACSLCLCFCVPLFPFGHEFIAWVEREQQNRCSRKTNRKWLAIESKNEHALPKCAQVKMIEYTAGLDGKLELVENGLNFKTTVFLSISISVGFVWVSFPRSFFHFSFFFFILLLYYYFWFGRSCSTCVHKH